MHVVLDDVEVFGQRSAVGRRRRDDRPVKTAPGPSGPVEIQDPRHDVQVAVDVIADGAVVDVAGQDDLLRAVTIDVGDRGCAVCKVWTVLGAAVRKPAKIRRLVDVDSDLAPHLAGAVDRVRRDLVAVSIECRAVMRVRRADDLLEAVAVDVAHRHVLVVHAGPESGIRRVPRRPSWPDRPVRLVDAQLERSAARRAADDDLELSVVLEIGDRQRSHFTVGKRVARPQHRARVRVDRQLVPAAPDDHLERPVARQVGDRDPGPHAARIGAAPFDRARRSVEGNDVVRSPDDIHLSVVVEVRDGRRRVPARLAEARATALLPLQDGRPEPGRRGRVRGRGEERELGEKGDQ